MHSKIQAVITGSVFGSNMVFEQEKSADQYKTAVVAASEATNQRVDVPNIYTFDGKLLLGRKGYKKEAAVKAGAAMGQLRPRVALVNTRARHALLAVREEERAGLMSLTVGACCCAACLPKAHGLTD